jgi:branched-chain amino acid transport system substrate-binding protein
VHDLGWHPTFFLTNVSISVGSVMNPAGPENGIGIITSGYMKDPTDPAFKDDAGMNEWRAFMAKYVPSGDVSDANYAFAYGVSMVMLQILKQCNGDFSRENIMKQAANLNFEIGIYLPGTRIKTSPTDFAPIEQLQMQRFKGETWERFGPVLSGEKNS